MQYSFECLPLCTSSISHIWQTLRMESRWASKSPHLTHTSETIAWFTQSFPPFRLSLLRKCAKFSHLNSIFPVKCKRCMPYLTDYCSQEYSLWCLLPGLLRLHHFCELNHSIICVSVLVGLLYELAVYHIKKKSHIGIFYVLNVISIVVFILNNLTVTTTKQKVKKLVYHPNPGHLKIVLM